MKKLQYLLFSIFLGIAPAFAEEGESLPIMEEQLPEIPNIVDSATSQASYGIWEQYGGYIIVALSAIALLILFIILYIFILRKSKMNFAKGKVFSSSFQQQLMTPQERLNSESTLPEAIKTFLLKTDLLP